MGQTVSNNIVINGVFIHDTSAWNYGKWTLGSGITQSLSVRVGGILQSNAYLACDGYPTLRQLTDFQLSFDGGSSWSSSIPAISAAEPDFYEYPVTLPAGSDGIKTVHVRYLCDGVLATVVHSADIVLDTHTIPTGTIAAIGNINATAITLRLSASTVSGAAPAQMRFSGNGTTWTVWESYATTKGWTLPSGDGAKTVYAQFKDDIGLVSNTASSTGTLKTTLPTVLALVLNGGAAYAGSPQLDVEAYGTSDVTSLFVSRDQVTWFPLFVNSGVATGGYSLGSVPDALYTVYAYAMDDYGNTSPVVSSTITLDTVPPDTAITSTHPAVTNATTQTFEFSSTVANSTFQFSLNGGDWFSATSPYTTAVLSDGNHQARIRAVSPAGNADPTPATVSWTIDTVTGKAVLSGVPSSPTNTDTASITVAGTGVVAYKYQLNDGGWSAETPVATPISLASLTDAVLLEVIGKTSGGLWQLVPTVAAWTVAVRVFDTTQPLSWALAAEIENYPLFESDQPFTTGLDASADWTPLQTFTSALTASFSGGTPEMVFESSQPWAFGLSGDILVPGAVVSLPFESAQAFIFGTDAAFIAGKSYDSSQPFTFAVSASLEASKSFESVQLFTFGLAAEMQRDSDWQSVQPFTFGIAADFSGYQQWDSEQAWSFGLDAAFFLDTPSDTVAYVLNLKTLGGGEYSNFPFTSLFRQGLECYGAKAGGIYHLTGKTDDTATIDAVLVGALSDFDNRNKKFFPYAHMYLRGEGELELTVTTDETKRRAYPVVAREGQQGVHTKRVKLARGINSRSVQIEVRNVDGSDFDLQEVQLTYETTGRT